MEFFSEFGYIGLFIAAFLAATILPLSSELVLSALLLNGLTPTLLVMSATVGNVLGSLLNYALGYWASMGTIQKWLNLSDSDFLKAKARFTQYGLGALLFSWVPIIGDPLTIIAGILRIRLLWFICLVSTGKLFRYIIITYLTLSAI